MTRVSPASLPHPWRASLPGGGRPAAVAQHDVDGVAGPDVTLDRVAERDTDLGHGPGSGNEVLMDGQVTEPPPQRRRSVDQHVTGAPSARGRHVVVLHVAKALDVEELDRVRSDRIGTPVPGAPVQHDRGERFEHERPDPVRRRPGEAISDPPEARPPPRRRRPAASPPGCGWRGGRAPRSGARRRPPAPRRDGDRSRFTWTSVPGELEPVGRRRAGSVSATGSHPNGAQPSRVSGTGVIWRMLSPMSHAPVAIYCVDST